MPFVVLLSSNVEETTKPNRNVFHRIPGDAIRFAVSPVSQLHLSGNKFPSLLVLRVPILFFSCTVGLFVACNIIKFVYWINICFDLLVLMSFKWKGGHKLFYLDQVQNNKKKMDC